jgi:hypothetical protein
MANTISRKGRGQKVTRVMVAERLFDAWNRITPDFVDYAWCMYQPEWDEDQDGEEVGTKDDEYRHVISFDDLRDL